MSLLCPLFNLLIKELFDYPTLWMGSATSELVNSSIMVSAILNTFSFIDIAS